MQNYVTSMQNYRLFFLSAARKIVTAEVVECADDADATEQARRFLAARPATHAVEIWSMARLVGTIDQT